MKYIKRAAILSLSAAIGLVSLAGCSDNNVTNPGPRPSQIVDPAGDFLSGFTGPNNKDLDVLQGEVSFDGSNFLFTSTQAGAIGTTPGALYVWGVNRGAGAARFGTLAPGVVFDFVVTIKPSGTSSVRDLITNTATDLPAANITFSGASIQATVPAALLPSQGLAPTAYTVNLWPRTGIGSNAQISDFAPDNSMAPIRVTH